MNSFLISPKGDSLKKVLEILLENGVKGTIFDKYVWISAEISEEIKEIIKKNGWEMIPC